MSIAPETPRRGGSAEHGAHEEEDTAQPDRFSQLPDALLLRMASLLPQNEVSCVLRLLNRATKKIFSAPEHRVVHLSKPVAPIAFTRRWGIPGAMRSLTRKKRYQLLGLVAGSGGSVANVTLALQATGLSCLTNADVYCAAAASGCLETCKLLWQHDCGISLKVRDAEGMRAAIKAGMAEVCIWLAEEYSMYYNTDEYRDYLDLLVSRGKVVACRRLLEEDPDLPLKGMVMAAAARAGDLALCQSLHQEGYPAGRRAFKGAVQGGHRALHSWLLDSGAVSHIEAAAAAAEAGNVQLLNELLDDEAAYASSPAKWWNSVLAAAAKGCDLPTLQALFERAAVSCAKDGRPLRICNRTKGFILAAAVNSPMPDWQAKAEWLLADPQGFRAAWDKKGYPITPFLPGQKDSPTAAARLIWLHANGFLSLREAARKAETLLPRVAARGDLAAMELLLDTWAGLSKVAASAINAALDSGHWMAALLLDSRGIPLSDHNVAGLARLGVVEPLEWLLGRPGAGVVLSRRVFLAAVELGSVEVMTWFLERGFQLDGEVFVAAVRGGCEEALEWLAERGCDMGADGAAYVEAARHGDLLILDCLRRLGCPFGTTTFAEACRLSPLAPLRWMVEQGFPVDWGAAEEKARQGGRAAEVLVWLAGLVEVLQRRP